MNKTSKSILCPIDLSDNRLAALELATTLAKQSSANVNLMDVAVDDSGKKYTGILAMIDIEQRLPG